jgi:uncharacterized protein (TIGR00297 family)
MSLPLRLGLGLALSLLISLGGYWKRALTRTGVGGAVFLGTVIFGFGGWDWGMVLITFFVLSSALSYYKQSVKQSLAEKFAKGSRRDLAQTFANAGLGALIALISWLLKRPTLLAAYVGAMATVNADTWATELGVLSRRPPRLITTGAVVEPGTSGGISRLGTLATLLGGLVIGLAAALFALLDGGMGARDSFVGLLPLLPTGMLGGLAGSLCDSFLGATVQAIYYSRSRDKETEKEIDPDGTHNELVRGWPWLDNDWVNFLSSGVGALVALGVWQLF